jgi:hypothetical protein
MPNIKIRIATGYNNLERTLLHKTIVFFKSSRFDSIKRLRLLLPIISSNNVIVPSMKIVGRGAKKQECGRKGELKHEIILIQCKEPTIKALI